MKLFYGFVEGGISIVIVNEFVYCILQEYTPGFTYRVTGTDMMGSIEVSVGSSGYDAGISIERK